MIVEIVSIGTEILLGDITDTNSSYIATQLTANGFDIHYISTVGDNKGRLVETLKNAIDRSDIVITTGGLGPTDDDLTREAISLVTGRKLIQSPVLLKQIKEHFFHHNYKMTENNKKQALLPRGAKPIVNQLGTAPGILLETDNYIILSFPGVPREMKNMFEKEALPYLKKYNKEKIKSKVLKFFGIGESTLETKIKDILDRQTNPTLALLAGTGEVKLRITAKGRSDEEIQHLINDVELEIRNRVGKYIYGVNNDSLPEIVGKALDNNGLKLSIAESCTGGLIGNRITNVPGSSKYFLGSLVTYSNRLKKTILGVKEETLAEFGAVSKETAIEMATGVRIKTGADIGLSVTGIAGPGGWSNKKPVGLVYIGLDNGNKNKVFKLNLKGDRFWVKWMSSQYSLYYLYSFFKNI